MKCTVSTVFYLFCIKDAEGTDQHFEETDFGKLMISLSNETETPKPRWHSCTVEEQN